MAECKHKWINLEDGTLDKFCIRCRAFAKQAVLEPMQAPLSQPLAQPIARETIEVPFYNGSEHTRITVYKDEILKQMNEEIGLTFSPISYRLGC